ncbi:MAG TPA: CoA ester lyase, partial [Nitriliruptorales bacterium]|nr:CoA ester lyase [Nitriliruptorales bacterium]
MATRTTYPPRRLRPRRSCLAVPGSSEKMLAKAQGLDADQVFLDLEDSVAPDVKEEARPLVVDALRDGDWGDKVRVVRVNDVSTRWTLGDLQHVVSNTGPGLLDCIMVPKVEDASQVHFVDHVLTQIERTMGWQDGAIGLEIQIENAAGLTNADVILAASDRIETFVFGPGDMAAALGMPSLTVGAIQPDYPGDHWHWVLMRVLVAARNRGVLAIDGPYAQIRDVEGFREVATRSRVLGFDGKWVLHPGQIAPANEIYGVSREAYERAEDILDAYADATQRERKGAVMFGEEMIDEASRKMAEVNALKGRAAGLQRREVPEGVPFHERAEWRREHHEAAAGAGILSNANRLGASIDAEVDRGVDRR